jgi:hypothetical protein
MPSATSFLRCRAPSGYVRVPSADDESRSARERARQLRPRRQVRLLSSQHRLRRRASYAAATAGRRALTRPASVATRLRQQGHRFPLELIREHVVSSSLAPLAPSGVYPRCPRIWGRVRLPLAPDECGDPRVAVLARTPACPPGLTRLQSTRSCRPLNRRKSAHRSNKETVMKARVSEPIELSDAELGAVSGGSFVGIEQSNSGGNVITESGSDPTLDSSHFFARPKSRR